MPAKTTAQAFDECDDNLKLDPRERLRAEALHRQISDVLQQAGLIVLAFLQGSFARKTMIAPLRDVDKVMVLAPTLRGLGPVAVLDRIEAELRIAFPGAKFERTRHSLKIDFGPTSFDFDAVPAWETDSDDDDVLIANAESGGWDRSNTRELMRAVSVRNSETGRRFVHQARMGKQVIKHLLEGSIPGLHVESWAYIAITDRLPHDEACARLLETGARLLGTPYYEPTGRDLISSRMKPDIVEAAKPVLGLAAGDARFARRLADAGDHDEAIRIWHSLLGDCFPAPPMQDEGTALRRSFTGGGLTPAGTVSRVRRTPQPSQPVRPWRPE